MLVAGDRCVGAAILAVVLGVGCGGAEDREADESEMQPEPAAVELLLEVRLADVDSDLLLNVSLVPRRPRSVERRRGDTAEAAIVEPRWLEQVRLLATTTSSERELDGTTSLGAARGVDGPRGRWAQVGLRLPRARLETGESVQATLLLDDLGGIEVRSAAVQIPAPDARRALAIRAAVAIAAADAAGLRSVALLQEDADAGSALGPYWRGLALEIEDDLPASRDELRRARQLYEARFPSSDGEQRARGELPSRIVTALARVEQQLRQ